MPETTKENIEKETGRLDAFSDGVFAVTVSVSPDLCEGQA
jgi:uncharacterized membrane protein